MALRVAVGVARAFRLRAAPARAFAFLGDVPAWGALFPHVESVTPLDGVADAFVWTMAPLGPPGVAVRTVYACRYASDDTAHRIDFEPVDGVGNAQFSGAVALHDADGGTAGDLRLDAVLEIPAPAFARAIVEPAVSLAFRQMTATFLERLDAALGDGV